MLKRKFGIRSDQLQKKRMEIPISHWIKRGENENDVILSIDWQRFRLYVLFGVPSNQEIDFISVKIFNSCLDINSPSDQCSPASYHLPMPVSLGLSMVTMGKC